jgi:carboxyl-terminal processing protease
VKTNKLLRLVAALAAASLGLGLFLARVHLGSAPARAQAIPAAAAVASNGPVGEAASGHEGGGGGPEAYELGKLPILSRVIIYVKENYVDPRLVDPKAMLVAALDRVEKTVAEVMVEGSAVSGKVKVTTGSATREFDISKVDSIWQVRTVLGEIMGFVQQNLVAHKDLREIEYAAANGALSTLDPHSALLEPRFFREMKLQTRGEFGGLGFVIAMRDGNLTVVRVLKNTPAQRAGIRAKDLITKIEDQSTINMDLQDAVDRLRGKPGTRVAITVLRSGWPESRRLGILRDTITYQTIAFAKLLDKGVGYVKVSQFSAITTRDLQAAIAQQRTEAGGSLKGLILDLRGNPGGLLEQAIQVADLFLSEGVIVKTVSEGERRRSYEVKEATPQREDMLALPLVVIVNGASASASEIVAGALKNNNRALVIGRQTFGKGSVQMLYEDLADGGKPGENPALKLTVAQYLTPGDVSIQEVGITPDVLLLPGRALKDAVNYFAPPRSMGEADLERHFKNPLQSSPGDGEKRAEERRRLAEKAPLELRYLLDEKEDQVAKALKAEQKREDARKARASDNGFDLTPEQQEDEDADANPDELVEDYQIRFAEDLLSRAPYPDRAQQLEAAKGLVSERRAEEDARVQSRLALLGVDWSLGPQQGTPRAAVTVSPPPGKRVQAGENVPWTVTVENRGDGPFRRLRAWTLVDKNPFLDRREFVFGQVRPGEKRSWTVPLKLPRGLDSRLDDVTFHFEEEGARSPPDVVSSLEVLERPRPLFAFSTQVDDEASGNGDGLVERGEDISLRVDVRNAGPGTSGDKTFAAIKNLGDEKIFIKKGRAVLGAMKPGEVATALFQLEVRKGLKLDKVPLRVTVVDEKLEEYVSERIELPVQAEALTHAAAQGGVRVAAAEAIVQSGAAADAAPIALARKGAVLPVIARMGGYYKVEWQKGRFGFAAASDVQAAPRAKREGTVSEIWQREPPRISLSPDPGKGAPVVEGERWRIEGKATAPEASGGMGTRLRDVFVFVNDKKVFFKVVPDRGASNTMDFAAEFAVNPGNNTVTVYAREDEEFQSRRTVVVHRRTPAEVAEGTKRR